MLVTRLGSGVAVGWLVVGLFCGFLFSFVVGVGTVGLCLVECCDIDFYARVFVLGVVMSLLDGVFACGMFDLDFGWC